ncbi:hypothetical protein ElyMa_007066000 [Elysia marginata]|uniref:Fibrinogen C-terminal domain-containing protein n=1 Tax=Elysia marginata TaxID=1093978 RepID=A0AAV4JXS6_9GAST|nr:hypothetical protein ElyMa_007066000 [Elysia marginata]
MQVSHVHFSWFSGLVLRGISRLDFKMLALQGLFFFLVIQLTVASCPNDDDVYIAKIKCDKQPRSCRDVKGSGSDKYKLVTMADGLEMLCELASDNGGWTVIQV